MRFKWPLSLSLSLSLSAPIIFSFWSYLFAPKKKTLAHWFLHCTCFNVYTVIYFCKICIKWVRIIIQENEPTLCTSGLNLRLFDDISFWFKWSYTYFWCCFMIGSVNTSLGNILMRHLFFVSVFWGSSLVGMVIIVILPRHEN